MWLFFLEKQRFLNYFSVLILPTKKIYIIHISPKSCALNSSLLIVCRHIFDLYRRLQYCPSCYQTLCVLVLSSFSCEMCWQLVLSYIITALFEWLEEVKLDFLKHFKFNTAPCWSVEPMAVKQISPLWVNPLLMMLHTFWLHFFCTKLYT